MSAYAEVFPPGEFIREELEAREWTQGDLSEILGRPMNLVNEIILGKRAITPETAQGLADAFGTTPQLWLNLESTYQLSQLKSQSNAVSRRAKLYEKAPVKEMVRRGWIEPSKNIDVQEDRIMKFFGLSNIENHPIFWPFAARSKMSHQSPNSSHWAWLFRAKTLARAVHAEKFSETKLDECFSKLQSVLPDPEGVARVPKILAQSGIRFLIVEHLSKTKIDGACFWLNKTSPAVVLSLRYDRIDGFWHTLFHELGHVKYRHGLNEYEAIDINLVGTGSQSYEEKCDTEQLVDAFASDKLISATDLDYFIARVKPLFSKKKILAFSNRIKVHPGIVVGQLQFKREIPFSHNREMLVNVRNIITSIALTDGWGNIPVGV